MNKKDREFILNVSLVIVSYIAAFSFMILMYIVKDWRENLFLILSIFLGLIGNFVISKLLRDIKSEK